MPPYQTAGTSALQTRSDVPRSSTPSTSHSYAEESVGASEKLIDRLITLRGRLNGEGGAINGAEKAPSPCGVLPMASTTLCNLHVATKILSEIELLIG